MVEDKTPQDTVQISGHVALQNVSYDKDVVEIKLADTVDSHNYGSNFVKDVCVDEGPLLHPKISEQKPVDKRSSPNFSSQMIDTNNEIRCGKEDDSRKSVHELKPEAVAFAPDCKNEKQHSSSKECDLENEITTDCAAGDISEKKISLQELLRLESAEESRNASTINSESSEKHKCLLHEEAVGQTSKDGFPDVQAILTNTSEHINSDILSKENTSFSGMMSEDHDAAAALDVREPHKIDRYNPFVDHRSLENATGPECSIPGTTHAASTSSICTVDNVVSGSTGLDETRIAEPRTDEGSASSEESNDHSESNVSKTFTGAVDETVVATSSLSSNAEPSDANGENQEKCVSDSVADPIDVEHCIGTDDAVSKGSTLVQDHSMVEQTAPESLKSTACVGNDGPSELNFLGPSIMSGPVSMSGHLAYSGNVSLRSDSSTTSTRSFAFPVLQREWISSPVRMAKAERQRARRHRAWTKGLICCKF